MSGRLVRRPGPDHPIAIEPAGRVTVTVAGRTIATSHDALRLSEAHYPPIFYIPRGHIAMAALERSATISWCPYKGEATYYAMGPVDIAWSYDTPHPAVAAIAGMLAFYPDRVDAIVEEPLTLSSAAPAPPSGRAPAG